MCIRDSKTGAFEFEDDIPANTDIYVEGGYDLGTGKPNEQKFKLTTSITGDGSEALVISPVSTQISRAYSKSGVTLSEAQEKVGKAYGLDEAFDNLTNFDPIALAYSSTSNEQAKAALTAQARNIMVSSLGEVSKKVSEYFASEIAPTTRSQISDIFKFGTQTLRYSSWDSNVDLQEQPRIVIELEGFEDLLASTSETFNEKIVEAILASEDLEKLFEPFQTSKDPRKGLGLGLAISSNIISELGGSLSGENLTPTGAEFTIKLPLFDPSRVNVVEENQTKMRETL